MSMSVKRGRAICELFIARVTSASLLPTCPVGGGGSVGGGGGGSSGSVSVGGGGLLLLICPLPK